MKSSFFPKYEPKYFCPVYGRKILTIFGSYFGRKVDFIISSWNLMTFSSSVTHALHCWLSFTKRIHVKRKKKKWASKKYIWCSNLDRTKHVLTKLRFEKAFEHFVKVLNLLRFIQWIKVKTNNRVSHAITFHALQNRKICNVNHGVKNSVNCSPLEVKVQGK